MCGVLGSYSLTGRPLPLNPSLLSHRGPDDSGEWVARDGACRLAHTRLSILDLSEAGSQPMVSRNGRYVIVFNGEIYNHAELRKHLPGHEWRGHSDTETLLELWAVSGPEMLVGTRGMFAFAIYDCEKESLTLVRDRLGIKPLYYQVKDGGLIFASEVWGITSGRNVTMNQNSVATYLTYGHLPRSGEIGDDLSLLAPGYLLRMEPTRPLVVKEWWRLSLPPSPRSPSAPRREGAMREIRRLLESSVEEHLMADVPVASFLSGGIDSSILSILAARALPRPLKTFCVGFPGESEDERAIARVVSQACSSEHHEIVLSDRECLEWTREAVNALDVPSADAVNTYIVSKAVAREGVKVALSGLGGDELFGGYPSFHEAGITKHLYSLPDGVRKEFLRLLPRKIREKLSGLERWSAYQFAIQRRRWMTTRELNDFGLDSESAAMMDYDAPQRGEDLFQEVTRGEIEGYMQPMLLIDSDQMSMAVSLELRVPFLDHRLVEYVYGLPMELKRGRLPKQLLIDAFLDVLPECVWNRPKKGFVLPMDRWMRGPLANLVEEGLQSLQGVVSPDFVRKRREDFDQGQIHWTRLWQLVILGHFMKKRNFA